MLLTAFLLASISLFAQQKFSLSNCEIQLAGTSTLHDWTADVETVTGNGVFEIANNELTGISSLNLTMKAESIKSEKGSMMDKNIYKALKTSDFPNLTFSLTEVTSLQKSGNGYAIMAKGKLTVAGTTKTISLTASGKMDGNGTLTFTGSKALKMTDYNVEPPELFFGTLVTADDVTIIFEATFASNGTTPN